MRLLFHPEKLGTNIGDTARELSEVLSSAPQPEGAAPLSYLARHAIKTDYEAKIPDLLKKAQTALHNPDLKYEPEFQEIGQKLKGLKEKDRPDRWEYNLGNFAIQYFESLIGTLESENFVEDDLLREGFAEGVPNGVVKWRLVDKMNNGGKDPEVILEGGNLVIQVCVSARTFSRIERLMIYSAFPRDSGSISGIPAKSWWISCEEGVTSTEQGSPVHI